eukprot:6203177-Pleurochrysis_carterae.AAC.4
MARSNNLASCHPTDVSVAAGSSNARHEGLRACPHAERNPNWQRTSCEGRRADVVDIAQGGVNQPERGANQPERGANQPERGVNELKRSVDGTAFSSSGFEVSFCSLMHIIKHQASFAYD